MEVHLESGCILLVALSHAFVFLGQRPCHLPKLREEDESRTNNEEQVTQIGLVDHRQEGNWANQIKGWASHRGKEVDTEPEVRAIPLGVMQPFREICKQKSQRSYGIEPSWYSCSVDVWCQKWEKGKRAENEAYTSNQIVYPVPNSPWKGILGSGFWVHCF